MNNIRSITPYMGTVMYKQKACMEWHKIHHPGNKYRMWSITQRRLINLLWFVLYTGWLIIPFILLARSLVYNREC